MSILANPNINIRSFNNDSDDQLPAINRVNVTRVMDYLQRKSADVLMHHCYEPNNDVTRQHIADSIKNFALNAGASGCEVDIDDPDPAAEKDELSRQCQTFAEYKMKKAVVSGDIVEISEEEFLKRKNYDKNALNVHIKIDHPVKTEQIVMNFKASPVI